MLKVGGMAVGHQWPNLLPVKIIGVIDDISETSIFYEIEFMHNGKKITRLLPDFRLKKYEPQLNIFKSNK